MDAFVIQAFGGSEGEDHKHFKAVFKRVRDVVGRYGYDNCIRADEVDRSGAITKDIIERLAKADLVIADLTGLNPNVYYELGVRHALRAGRTIMMLDETRTEHIPFDLSAYRVIKFRADLVGIGKFEEALAAAVTDKATGIPGSDNPVHDWLPELPVDALAAAEGSDSGELRRQLKNQDTLISRYRERFGDLEVHSSSVRSPLTVVMSALDAARAGNTPDQLVRLAADAERDRDIEKFLDAARRIVENEVRIDKRGVLAIASSAGNLGLPDVSRSILSYALEYSDSDEIRTASLMRDAHSANAEERAVAMREFSREAGISLNEEGLVTVPASLSSTQSHALGFLLDALHSGRFYSEGFVISYAWVQSDPHGSKALRELARSYKQFDEKDLSVRAYRCALDASDLDDTTARWLGNMYHNDEEHVNAIEAFVLASRLDPDDGILFAHVADEMSFALKRRVVATNSFEERMLPEQISEEDFMEILGASMSCPNLGVDSLSRLESASMRADVDVRVLGQLSRDMTRPERVAVLDRLYGILASEVTEVASPPEEGWKDVIGGKIVDLRRLGLFEDESGEKLAVDAA